MPKAFLSMAAAVLLAAGAAAADQVWLLTSDGKSETPRENVTVTDLKQTQLVFRLPSGSVVSRELKEVTRIHLDEVPLFTQAEEAVKLRKFDEAMKAYADSAAAAPKDKDWLGRLAALRALRAAKLGKMPDKAFAAWIKIVDQFGVSDETLAMRPDEKGFGEKGSTANALAITALEAKLAGLKGGKKEYAAAIQQSLMKLYELEGQDKRATDMARALSGVDAAPPGAATTAGPAGQNVAAAASPKEGNTRLAAAKMLMDKGQVKADELEAMVKSFQADRDKYRMDELPLAMLIAGRAQMMLCQAQAGKTDTTPLVGAGLNLMRVYVYYPESPEAAEALFYAAQVNLDLGNRPAAQKAYETLVQNYKSSAFAQKASSALEALKKVKDKTEEDESK